ncbi:UBP1-associated protein 2B [Ananas comosus]|uniref:UBP1-associated protein 2B n=1 Tax=Ananas comosus TaxID=4615 RepID=A0A199VPK3_ANACO|nr:UBP1-associated protein 2B [Ananas comosus]
MAKKRKPESEADAPSSSQGGGRRRRRGGGGGGGGGEEEELEVDEEESTEEYDDDEDEDEEDEEKDESNRKKEENVATSAAAAAAAAEETIDPSDPDSVRKLLEPFGKDQLVELLTEAALKSPSLLSRLSTSADADPVHRNIFVHGLGWDTTADALSAAFAPFGEIEECKVVSDRATGRCKGYGFVRFKTRAAAKRALKEPQKRIGNRSTSCQLASFGPPGSQGAAPEATGRKLFVSNIPTHAAPDRLRAFFQQFGEIEEGPVGVDRATGRLRGFAIFVYKTVDGCRKALEEPKKMFDGCELQCQRALEGLKPKTPAGPTTPPTPPVAAAQAPLQPNDLALQSWLGYNQMAGLVGQGLSPATPMVGLLGQNAGVGLLGPAIAGAMAAAGGVSGATQPLYGVGVGLGGGGGFGINSISPSAIASYGSQAALQGFGAYQSNQPHSTVSLRSQSGIGSGGSSLPPYVGR